MLFSLSFLPANARMLFPAVSQCRVSYSHFLSRYRFRYRRAEISVGKARQNETRTYVSVYIHTHTHTHVCVCVYIISDAPRLSCTFITITVALLPNGYALPS